MPDNNKPTTQSSFIPSGVTTGPMIKSTNANKAAEDLQLNLENEQAAELQRAEQETKARQQQEQPLDEFNQRTSDESYKTGFAPSGGKELKQGEFDYHLGNDESTNVLLSDSVDNERYHNENDSTVAKIGGAVVSGVSKGVLNLLENAGYVADMEQWMPGGTNDNAWSEFMREAASSFDEYNSWSSPTHASGDDAIRLTDPQWWTSQLQSGLSSAVAYGIPGIAVAKLGIGLASTVLGNLASAKNTQTAGKFLGALFSTALETATMAKQLRRDMIAEAQRTGRSVSEAEKQADNAVNKFIAANGITSLGLNMIELDFLMNSDLANKVSGVKKLGQTAMGLGSEFLEEDISGAYQHAAQESAEGKDSFIDSALKYTVSQEGINEGLGGILGAGISKGVSNITKLGNLKGPSNPIWTYGERPTSIQSPGEFKQLPPSDPTSNKPELDFSEGYNEEEAKSKIEALVKEKDTITADKEVDVPTTVEETGVSAEELANMSDEDKATLLKNSQEAAIAHNDAVKRKGEIDGEIESLSKDSYTKSRRDAYNKFKDDYINGIDNEDPIFDRFLTTEMEYNHATKEYSNLLDQYNKDKEEHEASVKAYEQSVKDQEEWDKNFTKYVKQVQAWESYYDQIAESEIDRVTQAAVRNIQTINKLADDVHSDSKFKLSVGSSLIDLIGRAYERRDLNPVIEKIKASLDSTDETGKQLVDDKVRPIFEYIAKEAAKGGEIYNDYFKAKDKKGAQIAAQYIRYKYIARASEAKHNEDYARVEKAKAEMMTHLSSVPELAASIQTEAVKEELKALALAYGKIKTSMDDFAESFLSMDDIVSSVDGISKAITNTLNSLSKESIEGSVDYSKSAFNILKTIRDDIHEAAQSKAAAGFYSLLANEIYNAKPSYSKISDTVNIISMRVSVTNSKKALKAYEAQLEQIATVIGPKNYQNLKTKIADRLAEIKAREVAEETYRKNAEEATEPHIDLKADVASRYADEESELQAEEEPIATGEDAAEESDTTVGDIFDMSEEDFLAQFDKPTTAETAKLALDGNEDKVEELHKKKKGRPKGSKNKPKQAPSQLEADLSTVSDTVEADDVLDTINTEADEIIAKSNHQSPGAVVVNHPDQDLLKEQVNASNDEYIDEVYPFDPGAGYAVLASSKYVTYADTQPADPAQDAILSALRPGDHVDVVFNLQELQDMWEKLPNTITQNSPLRNKIKNGKLAEVFSILKSFDTSLPVYVQIGDLKIPIMSYKRGDELLRQNFKLACQAAQAHISSLHKDGIIKFRAEITSNKKNQYNLGERNNVKDIFGDTDISYQDGRFWVEYNEGDQIDNISLTRSKIDDYDIRAIFGSFAVIGEKYFNTKLTGDMYKKVMGSDYESLPTGISRNDILGMTTGSNCSVKYTRKGSELHVLVSRQVLSDGESTNMAYEITLNHEDLINLAKGNFNGYEALVNNLKGVTRVVSNHLLDKKISHSWNGEVKSSIRDTVLDNKMLYTNIQLKDGSIYKARELYISTELLPVDSTSNYNPGKVHFTGRLEINQNPNTGTESFNSVWSSYKYFNNENSIKDKATEKTVLDAFKSGAVRILNREGC